MKTLSKIAAVISAFPVAGLVMLGGASAALAINCAPGYTPSTVNNVAICVPNSDGGVGGGGTGTVGSGGSTAPGQGAPVAPPVQQIPAPPAAPAPAPAPVPVPVAPAPIQQAPSIQIPAPAQNYAPAPGDAVNQGVPPAAVSDTPVGAISPEIVKTEDPKASESDATPKEDKASVGATLVPVEPGKKNFSASPSPSASSSATSSADPNLDASRASDNESSPKSLPGLLIGLGVVLIALLTWCLITINRTRSASRR